ncbi:hypothetical protein FOA52_004982 [Chlamydomonas sp. UWO 241]|nr:hypothetical protein FOA52_004982 [Chlamydomonas sp. UWO 241]
MSARPQGTDGMDHYFRQQVERAYKRLPVLRKWSGILQVVSLVPAIMRFMWYAVAGSISGLTPNYIAIAMFVMNVGALLAWRAAKPGSAKESLLLVKIAGSLNVVSMGLLFVTSYKYYNEVPAEYHVNALFATYISTNYGFSAEQAWSWTKDVDKTVDILMFCGVALVVGNMHPYITTQLQLLNRAKDVAALSAPAKKDDGPAAAAPKAIEAKPTAAAVEATSTARKRPARM